MNKIVLIPLIIAIIIYVVIFQTIPSVQAVLDARRDRDVKIDEIKKESEKLEKLNNFKSGVKTHQAEVEFVSNFIPRDPLENNIINILNQKAEDTGVSLFIVDPTDKVPRTSRSDSTALIINNTETNIILTGSYENIKKFLSEIFAINRMYSLDTLNIEKIVTGTASTGEATGGLNVNITLNYSYVSGNLTMSASDVSGLVNKSEENYKFINFVEGVTASLRDFEVGNPGRLNPFSPN